MDCQRGLLARIANLRHLVWIVSARWRGFEIRAITRYPLLTALAPYLFFFDLVPDLDLVFGIYARLDLYKNTVTYT